MKKSRLPVLMYHRVLTPEERKTIAATPYEILKDNFIAQLQFLKKEGFQSYTIDELWLPSHANHRCACPRGVAITFDDGYVDNYLHAFPVLQEFGYKATFFVIVNKIGSRDFMSWSQLLDMHRCGMSIQSHTLNHGALATLPWEHAYEEICEARQILQRELRHPANFISFPHGSYNARVIQAVLAAGYSGWCNSDFGYHSTEGIALGIPRIIVRDRHTLADFESLVYGRGPRYARSKMTAGLRRAMARTVGMSNYQRLYLKYYHKDGEGESS
ncbi:MAG: polysaccharide deacetylase family protein [bacterium]